MTSPQGPRANQRTARSRLYPHGTQLHQGNRGKGKGRYEGRLADFKESTPSEVAAGLYFHKPGSHNPRKH